MTDHRYTKTVSTHQHVPLKTLTDFGLSEKEAKIYLTLLELEIAGVSDISRKSGINRSSAYVVIESLKKKGLVNMTTDKKIQGYTASSPETLLQIAEEKLEKQSNIKDGIEKVLPELRTLHKDTKLRPKVQIYTLTDQQAIDSAYNTIFNEQTLKGMRKFRVFEDLSNIKKFLPPDYIKKDTAHLKKSGVEMQVITPNNRNSKSVVLDYKKHGSTDFFSIIPEKKFSHSKKTILGLSIYEDKIEFISQDPLIVVIESQEIADTLKNIFDLAWKESERLHEENIQRNKKPKTKHS